MDNLPTCYDDWRTNPEYGKPDHPQCIDCERILIEDSEINEDGECTYCNPEDEFED